MSSHHIVKENQEPALIVASSNALDSEHLGQLLEWSPTILTNDYAIDFLFAEGIKVDIVFTHEETTYAQEQIKKFPIKADFITEAMAYLISHNYTAVNIICDNLHPVFYRLAASINIVVFAAGKRMVFVRHDYEKWKVKGDRIYVEEAQLKSVVGLRKITENVFEVEQDGFFYLGFNSDNFVAVGERF